MGHYEQWLQWTWHQLPQVFSLQPLSLMLWCGLAALVAAWFIVMRTRLGQSKPIWTCAFLSIVAHILLIGYAYATHWMVPFPEPELEVVRFELVVDSEMRSNEEDDQTPSQQEGELDARRMNPGMNPWDAPPLELDQASEPLIAHQPPPIESPSLAAQPNLIDPAIAPLEAALPAELSSTAMSTGFDEIPQLALLPGSPAVNRLPIASADLESPETMGMSSESDELAYFADDMLDEPELSPPPPEMESEPNLEVPESLIAENDLVDDRSPLAVEGSVERAMEMIADGEAVEREVSEIEPQAWRPIAASGGSRREAVQPPPADPPATPTQSSNRPADASAAPVRAADGAPLPEIFHGRVAERDDAWLERVGGSPDAERAVELALDFLARTQEADGRWRASRFAAGQERQVLGHNRHGAGANADTAITALSLLAMMGAGNTHYHGQHANSVQRGLEFLLMAQAPDGNLFGNASFYAQMYCHSMATLALSEAYAMTGDERLRPGVQRAVDYTLRAQNLSDGGWRYRPGDAGDMSQFGWQVMALKSAHLAGIELPEVAWYRMRHFLRLCSSGAHGGLAAYRPGERPTPPMTAEALVCRFFLDAHRDPETIAEATRLLRRHLPGEGPVNYYYWYYATLGLQRVGGEAWEEWNRAMQPMLLGLQRQQGALRGSFEDRGKWSGYGGTIYSTALATLCLQAYYRYLPVQNDLK